MFTYRKDGLKYLVFEKAQPSYKFVKGRTEYAFSHYVRINDRPNSSVYHYKAMPNVQNLDFLRLAERPNEFGQIRFTRSVENIEVDKQIFYVVYDDMELIKVDSPSNVLEVKYWEENDDLHFEDQSNKHMTLRLPKYLYDVLKEQSSESPHGMSLNKTIQEALLFAIDMYFQTVDIKE